MKSALRAIKNEWNDYCEGERVVRELTSNDDEPVAIDKLKRLVYLVAAEPEHYQRTYMMIMRRVTDYAYFRHVEKGLITVEYLLKHADQRFARSCKRHIKHFDKLKTYTYSVGDRERGTNVRKTAGRIVLMLQNDDELETARARAQGLPKPKRASSSTDATKKEDKDDSKNIKPSSAKKQQSKKKQEQEKDKEKEKEKEVKKPKEQQAPTEDLLGDIFTNPQPKQTNAPDQWLDDFTFDDDQFQNSGVGEDGGAFGFGNFENEENSKNENDYENEKEPEENNITEADSLMLKLTQDPLQGGGDKPQKKVNKKGKTMVQMQSNQKDLTNMFDDSFLQTINAGLSGQTTTTTTTTQPTTQPSYPPTNQPLFGSDPFLFGSTVHTQPSHQSFGYQPQHQQPQYQQYQQQPQYQQPLQNNTQNLFGNMGTAQVNDPFAGLGIRQTNNYGNNTNPGGPVPATYQKPDKGDPFSSLSWK